MTKIPPSENGKREKTSDSGWQKSASDDREKYRSQSFDDKTTRVEKISVNEDGSHSHTYSQYNAATGQYGTGEKTTKDK